MIVINLPWPPAALSPNARKHWRALAPIRARYRQDCQWATLAANVGRISGRHHLLLTFHPKDRRHRDKDNLLANSKALIDGMADALGINDREFDPVTVSVGEPSKSPFVRVTITPYQEAA